ncbi:MAG: hypothetical protein DMG44_08300 [Acidobacteria bacterium]|nr:MAG: hypothetical protein DMG44_08300 [Acidobacteriota bacterium]
MNANDFRRIALSLEGAEESSHMGAADFRVGGRIFATLASEKQGYGNLMLTLERQKAFVDELPEVFLPIAGGWGRMGMTHIRMAAAKEDVMTGALQTAWKLRVEKNAKSGKKTSVKPKKMRVAKTRRKKR